jgi:hypothetical protein
VVEELIEQAPEMAALNPFSVNTVRVPTLKLKDRVVVFHPFLRIGRGKSVVDNAASGGIIAVADEKTGIVTYEGVDEKGNHFIRHPESNVIIPGFQIPKWDEAVELVTQLSAVVENNHYCGWDIALTKNGWVMVEGNPRGQLVVMQMFFKTGFRKELDAYIEAAN